MADRPGWYIGFTGVLTFKRPESGGDCRRHSLGPHRSGNRLSLHVPGTFRGKRNDPGKLYRMAERLAEIRGISVKEVRAATMENGKRLYRI